MYPYPFNRNGHYHLRVRTPSELLGIIPQFIIIKSLRTTDLKLAKVVILQYLNGIKQTATLLRSKFITPEQAQCRLGELLNFSTDTIQQKRHRVVKNEIYKKHLLSKVIKTYMSDKELEWTAKTKMENTGVFALLPSREQTH